MRVQSQRKKRKNRQRFAHHRLLTLIVCLSVVALAVLVNAFFYWQGMTTIRKNEAEISSTTALMDQKIARIKEERQLQAALAAEQSAKLRQAEALAAIRLAPISDTTADVQTCGITNPDAITVIINKKRCFDPIDYAPADLVSFDGFLLRKEAATQLRAMLASATTDGMPFSLSSAYRSYENQHETYQHWTSVNGSQSAADMVSARPGFSEHQTGLAVDLKIGGCALECFKSTPAYGWLKKHAAYYGFIERYPEDLTAITGYAPESWHWRYVGKDVALDMEQKGLLTLEKYLDVAGGNYE